MLSGLRESIESRNFRKSRASRHVSLVLRKPRGFREPTEPREPCDNRKSRVSRSPNKRIEPRKFRNHKHSRDPEISIK